MRLAKSNQIRIAITLLCLILAPNVNPFGAKSNGVITKWIIYSYSIDDRVIMLTFGSLTTLTQVPRPWLIRIYFQKIIFWKSMRREKSY